MKTPFGGKLKLEYYKQLKDTFGLAHFLTWTTLHVSHRIDETHNLILTSDN